MSKEINIEKGQILFEDGQVINFLLYPDIAPLTVSNFIYLCKSGFYNGLCFHRVIKKFMIQGGGFIQDKNKLVMQHANSITGEFKSNGHENVLKHKKGVFSMARTRDKNSASSQFFICVADSPYLDGEYAGFGECADKESLKTAIAISNVDTCELNGYKDVPCQPIVIKCIRIDKKEKAQ